MRVLGVGSVAVSARAELGRASSFLRVLDALAERHEVRRVLCWEGTRPAAVTSDTRLVEGPRASLWTGWAIRQEVRAFDPDVLVCAGPLPPPTRRPAIAVIRDLTLTGWDDVGDPRGFLLRRFRRVVVPTALVRRQVQRFGVDPFAIDVVPDPLPDVAPLPAPPDGGPLVLAQIGAIHPIKRPHLVIDAVSRLSGAEKGRVRLVVAGPARDARYLAQLRVQAEGQPVEFVVDPPSLGPTLGRARVVLYPSAVDEGWPDAAIFALAAGRMVWFSDRPALRDVLLGLGVPVREGVESWRGVIRQLLAGPVPRVPTTELVARFGPEVSRRRWREVLSQVR